MRSAARACVGCLSVAQRPAIARSNFIPTFASAGARLTTSAPLYKKKQAESDDFEEDEFEDDESTESTVSTPTPTQSNPGADYASLHTTLNSKLSLSPFLLKSSPPSQSLLRQLLALTTPETASQTTEILKSWRQKDCDLSQRSSNFLIRSFADILPTEAVEILKRRDLYGIDLPQDVVVTRQLMEGLSRKISTQDLDRLKTASLLLLDLARFHSAPLDGYSLLLACKIGSYTKIKDSLLQEAKALGKDSILQSIMDSGRGVSVASLKPVVDALHDVNHYLSGLEVTGTEDTASLKLFEELRMDLGVFQSRLE